MSVFLKISAVSTAAHIVTPQLIEVFEDYGEDVDLRYCSIGSDGENAAIVARLQALNPANDDEAGVIDELVARLAGGGSVSVIYG